MPVPGHPNIVCLLLFLMLRFIFYTYFFRDALTCMLCLLLLLANWLYSSHKSRYPCIIIIRHACSERPGNAASFLLFVVCSLPTLVLVLPPILPL